MQGVVLELVPVWTFLLGIAVFYYVLFDGFDLGVGILYGLSSESEWRARMMSSVAPVWDGNETWLILGGVGLFAAFPLAYAIIIPAVYFPIMSMLLALIFRGVAFEFRFKQPELRKWWDRAFCYGSTLAAFSQGVVLGTFIQGFQVSGRVYTGSSFDWVTPFAMTTGVALVFGYSLLGAGWLVIKTEHDLQAWARRAGRYALVGTVLAIVIVSVWTPFLHPQIANRWFSWPNIGGFAFVPILTAAVSVGEWFAFSRKAEFLPFFGAMGLFLLSYLGIAISLWPMIVPYHYSLWDAAASASTQTFLLIGTMFLLPIVLMYTAWSYWVFRGKVRGDVGYHG